MVLTLNTHVADCLVDVLNESKGNQSDPRGRVEVEHGFASGSDGHAFWSNSLCILSSFTAP